MKILCAGATGFIGKPLVRRLVRRGHDVVLLSRTPPLPGAAIEAGVRMLQWDGKTERGWAAEVEGADAVINLAGAPIPLRRWSGATRARLWNSRVNATSAIVGAIQASVRKPSLLVNASAVGYYGDVPEGEVREDYPKGNSFLSEMCAAWEGEAIGAASSATRVVLLRTGIVLAPDGGALAPMLRAFRLFVGGPLGNGLQWFPWIHREDVLSIIEFSLAHPALRGPVNVSAPQPARMTDFCATLGTVLRRPSWLAVPPTVLRLLFGETAAIVLGGQKLIPAKLLEHGFRFQYPNLEAALRNLLE